MSSATLNGVGPVSKSPVSKIVNLVSDDEDSENDGVSLNGVGVPRDTSCGMSHHQNASPQEVDRALSANESRTEVEDVMEDGEDDSENDDNDSLYEDMIEGLTDESIYDDGKFAFTS